MIKSLKLVFCFAVATLASSCTCSKRSVNLFIWSNYTSPDLLEEFHKRTGVRIVESNFSSNEELLAKLQAGASGYDLIIPSDYMVKVMRKLNLLRAIDRSKIANAKAINPHLLGHSFDPENSVSLPYSWGVSGIAYRKSQVTEKPRTWKDIFSNPKTAGKISLLDDAREAISVALKQKGKSSNSKDKNDLELAKEMFKTMKPLVKSFTSTPMPAILSGDVLVAHMYGNEAMIAKEKSAGEIEYVFPEEGGIVAIDNFAIPATAKNVEEAHVLIDFLLDRKNHAQFINRMFSGPVRTDMDDLLSENMRAHPLYGNFENIMKRGGEMLDDLGEAQELYDRLWTDIKAM